MPGFCDVGGVVGLGNGIGDDICGLGAASLIRARMAVVLTALEPEPDSGSDQRPAGRPLDRT